MKKIAIVDDEEDIIKIVSFYLEREGFKVEGFLSGELLLKSISKEVFDCIVLDLMLPGISGEDLLKMLRNSNETASVPVIVLTAKGDESDIVSVFEMGADDYVVKPFKGRVLAARVKALLRKKFPTVSLRSGGLILDPEKFKVFCGEKEIFLTSTEFEILRLLMSKKGRVFNRNEILNFVWRERADEPFDRVVDVHIRHIREKLGKCGGKIRTIRGVGYKILDE